METKLFSDERVLRVMAFVVKEEIKGVTSEKQFLASIGIPNSGNVGLVRSGTQSFTAKQLAKVVELYEVDANYLLNEKHDKMFHQFANLTAVMQLQEAVFRVEYEIAQSKRDAKTSKTPGGTVFFAKKG